MDVEPKIQWRGQLGGHESTMIASLPLTLSTVTSEDMGSNSVFLHMFQTGTSQRIDLRLFKVKQVFFILRLIITRSLRVLVGTEKNKMG